MEIFLEDGAFRAGLRSAQQQLQSFGVSVAKTGALVTAAGAGLTAPFVTAIETFRRVGDSLDKMNQRTGISVQSLGALVFATEQAGQTMEEFEKAIVGLFRQLFNLERGELRTVEAFQKLGLSIKDLQKLNPDEIVETIADRLVQIEDPARRGGIAMAVLGRAGRNLLPLFGRGAAGMAAWRKQAEGLGLIFSEELREKAADLTDALNELTRVFQAGLVRAGFAFADEAIAVTRSLTTLTVVVSRAISNYPELTKTLFTLGAAIAGLGVAATGAGLLVIGLNASLIALAGLAKFAVVSLAGVAAGLLGAFAAAQTFGGGIVSLGGTLRGLAAQGQAAMASVREEIFGTLTVIANAIKAGEIQAAIDVMWAGIEVAFKAGQVLVLGTMADFGVNIVSSFSSVAAQVQIVFSRLFFNIREGLFDTANNVVKLVVRAEASIRTFLLRQKNDLNDRLAEAIEDTELPEAKGLRRRLLAIKGFTTDERREIERSADAAIDALDEQRSAARGAAEKSQREFEDALLSSVGTASSSRAEALESRRDKAEKDLEAARAKLAVAEGAAVAKTRAANDDIAQQMEELNRVFAGFDEASKRGIEKVKNIGTVSTFEGQLASQLAGRLFQGPLESIDSHTEQTAKSTARIGDLIERFGGNPLGFA